MKNSCGIVTEGFLRRVFNVYFKVFPYKVSVKTLPFPVHKTSVKFTKHPSWLMWDGFSWGKDGTHKMARRFTNWESKQSKLEVPWKQKALEILRSLGESSAIYKICVGCAVVVGVLKKSLPKSQKTLSPPLILRFPSFIYSPNIYWRPTINSFRSWN